MIKLSIIIPIYNSEKFIERCLIKIITEQIDNIFLKLSEVELIIVNDGSTDNTEKIVNSIKRKYDNVSIILINKENKGVSIARNIGIKNAKGKYICFIDADDYLDANALPNLINICSITNCEVITFQYRNVYDSEIITKKSDKPIFHSPINGFDFIKLTNGLTWNLACWRNLYKRDFIINNEILFPTNIHRYEDGIFAWNVFIRAKNIINVENIFYSYVVHINSCMHNKEICHVKKLLESTYYQIIEFNRIKNRYPNVKLFMDRNRSCRICSY